MSAAPHTLTPGASTVVDSILFRDAFGTPAMREIFSDRSLIARYIEVEVALARAEARCGVIPAEAAEVIARESRLERIDFEHMREETDIVGYPILPLVHQMVELRFALDHVGRFGGDHAAARLGAGQRHLDLDITRDQRAVGEHLAHALGAEGVAEQDGINDRAGHGKRRSRHGCLLK